MNTYYLIAGILCFLLGIIHSFLGEYLIFKNKRNNGSLVPSKESAELKERHLRIIWATWHLASIFGWCIGALLLRISLNQNMLDSEFIDFIINSTTVTMSISCVIVLIGTKGKHPGWIVLLVIATLLTIGNC